MNFTFFFASLIFIQLMLRLLFYYRYEREVNYGHRSAIKKILDGDASPASLMILCISSIYSSASDTNKLNDSTEESESNQKVSQLHGATKIELTDGW